jgi:hypothetical protein
MLLCLRPTQGWDRGHGSGALWSAGLVSRGGRSSQCSSHCMVPLVAHTSPAVLFGTHSCTRHHSMCADVSSKI